MGVDVMIRGGQMGVDVMIRGGQMANFSPNKNEKKRYIFSLPALICHFKTYVLIHAT
jgi:hypothetical protein